jgi:hypothetical protein
MPFSTKDYIQSIIISTIGGGTAGAVTGAITGNPLRTTTIGLAGGFAKSVIEGAIRLLLSRLESIERSTKSQEIHDPISNTEKPISGTQQPATALPADSNTPPITLLHGETEDTNENKPQPQANKEGLKGK